MAADLDGAAARVGMWLCSTVPGDLARAVGDPAAAVRTDDVAAVLDALAAAQRESDALRAERDEAREAAEIERVKAKPVQFRHTVALGDYAIDLHGSMRKEWLETDLDLDSDIPHKFGERGLGPFAIPFESLIPETIDGFLPAEKNFSQSRMVNGATRLQPHTLNIGQAVGTIAALAAQENLAPRAVDPVKVQRLLLKADDTLAIDPVKARHGTEAWRELQMEVLRNGAEVK